MFATFLLVVSMASCCRIWPVVVWVPSWFCLPHFASGKMLHILYVLGGDTDLWQCVNDLWQCCSGGLITQEDSAEGFLCISKATTPLYSLLRPSNTSKESPENQCPDINLHQEKKQPAKRFFKEPHEPVSSDNHQWTMSRTFLRSIFESLKAPLFGCSCGILAPLPKNAKSFKEQRQEEGEGEGEGNPKEERQE